MDSQENFIENENQTKQSLELFKNWLSKQSFIKFNEDENFDDIFLHFLRLKNFNMDRAFATFESNLIFIKSHPDWFGNPEKSDYEFINKPDSPIVVLKKCDAEGRKIQIYKFKNFDKIEDVCKIIRMLTLNTLLTSFDQQTVQNGIVYVIDFRHVSLKSFSRISPKDYNESFKIIRKGIIKTKKMFLLGMPTFVVPVIELIKTFSSKKINERMIVVDNLKDLSKNMDISLLTKEYGGEAVEEDVDSEEFEHAISLIKLINKFEVDFSKIQDFENVGSFRKLDVD